MAVFPPKRSKQLAKSMRETCNNIIIAIWGNRGNDSKMQLLFTSVNNAIVEERMAATEQ